MIIMVPIKTIRPPTSSKGLGVAGDHKTVFECFLSMCVLRDKYNLQSLQGPHDNYDSLFPLSESEYIE